MAAKSAFEAFLVGRDPQAGSLARRLRTVLRKHLARPVEAGDRDNWGIGRGTGCRDTVFVIRPQRGYVTLGFYDGASLPDPIRLLEGEGKRHRHLKIRRSGQIGDPRVLRLIRAAVKRTAQG